MALGRYSRICRSIYRSSCQELVGFATIAGSTNTADARGTSGKFYDGRFMYNLWIQDCIFSRWYSDDGSKDRVISIDRSGLLPGNDSRHQTAFMPRPSVPEGGEEHNGVNKHTNPQKIEVGKMGGEMEGKSKQQQEPTAMTRHIQSLITYRGGPITLAEYMSEVLTNPKYGYYTQKDVFGARGDFITSPEISQLFGEMIGIWTVLMWQQLGKPPSIRIVELGPGRGTLMSDLLRGIKPFSSFRSTLEIALVEISPILKKLQWEKLKCQGEWNENCWEGVTADGIKVKWHRIIDEVPSGKDGLPTLYIAHEFFDALPVHHFENTERSWCERLVDIAPDHSSSHLQMVLSAGATPAAKTILPLRLEGIEPSARDSMKAIEVCPQGMALAENLAKRVSTDNGAALIIDYGRDCPYRDSLAAIRKHQIVDIFDQPGTSDLSAHVDFDALRWSVKRSGTNAVMHGPITQAELLGGLGIGTRLQQLLENANQEQEESLITGYLRLMNTRDNKSMKNQQNQSSPSGTETTAEGIDDPTQQIEGMGDTYVAACICPKHIGVPIPFLDSGV